MMVKGSLPALGTFMTKPGRIFLISAPIVGSKLTSQTSPLPALFIIERRIYDVQDQFGVALVKFGSARHLCFENPIPLRQGQKHQFLRRPSTWAGQPRYVRQYFLGFAFRKLNRFFRYHFSSAHAK